MAKSPPPLTFGLEACELDDDPDSLEDSFRLNTSKASPACARSQSSAWQDNGQTVNAYQVSYIAEDYASTMMYMFKAGEKRGEQEIYTASVGKHNGGG